MPGFIIQTSSTQNTVSSPLLLSSSLYLPMPYLYPAIPDAHKLWLKDSTLQGMTISDARKEVNELFKTAILELAGTPPLRSTVSPFHQGHAVKEIAVCYGAKSPIDRIGVWYAKVRKLHTSGCNFESDVPSAHAIMPFNGFTVLWGRRFYSLTTASIACYSCVKSSSPSRRTM